MTPVRGKEHGEQSISSTPDNLVQVNGEAGLLVDYARRYYLGERVNASLPGTLPKPVTTESFHNFLLTEQSLGHLDEYFDLTYVKKMYSPWHMMAIPNNTWPRVRNIQMEGIDPTMRNYIISSLYTNAGRTVTALIQHPDYHIEQVALGINGGKNKSIPELFHMQMVGFDPDDWEEFGYKEIPTKAPHRLKLLTHNDGFTDTLPDVPYELSGKYPDLLTENWVMTKGASIFMECTGPLYVLAQQPDFPDLMVDVDAHLRHVNTTAGIHPDQQSFSFALIQHRDHPDALLAFAPSAKMGVEPSGMCETMHRIFENQTANGNIRELSSEENGKYLENTGIFAGIV